MEMLGDVWDAAKHLFEAFGKGVENYPLPTLFMLVVCLFAADLYTDLSFTDDRGEWKL